MNDIERLWKEGSKLKAVCYAIVYVIGAAVIGFIFWLTKAK